MKIIRLKKIITGAAAFLLALLLGAAAIFAQADEGKRAAAKKIYDEAMTLYQQRTAESYRAAREKFLRAADLFAAVGDGKQQGISLVAVGGISADLGEKTAALEIYEKALPLFRASADKKWESVTLNNIGRIYEDLGEKRRALEFYDESLAAARAAGDRAGEAGTLNNIGKVYADLGDARRALDFYNQSLPLARAAGDKTFEAITIGNIGGIYDHLGDKRRALEFYNESLPLVRAVGDKTQEAVTLLNIGGVYNFLGEKQKAIDYYNQSLPLARAVGYKEAEAATLTHLGTIYSFLGENQKALEFYNQSLPISRRIGDRAQEAATLNYIGDVYSSLGDNRKALKYYNDALPLARAIGDKSKEALTLSNLGFVYNASGEKTKSLDFYRQSLTISRAVGDRARQAGTLNNVGGVYVESGNDEEAVKYFQQSLTLARAVGEAAGQANTLGNLMSSWNTLKNAPLAILYGKQSVNNYQQLRSNIVSFDKETQKNYLKSIAATYRRLADILIENGRIAEAEEVLQMLKEEEFFAYLRRSDKVAADLKGRISLSPDEKKAFADYETFADDISRAAAEFGALEKKKSDLPLGESLPADERKQYDALKEKYDAAVVVFDKFLNDLKVQFGGGDKRVAVVESDTQGILKRLGEPRTVIVSTIVGEDRLNLIVTTSDTQRAHTVEIKAADLNKLVSDFRDAVKNPRIDPRLLGKKLYDILFPAALQKDLDGIRADTIVWSLDGTLRYVPTAALWDGKQYLVERYTNAVLTLASRDKLGVQAATNRAKWLALGVGVSKAANVKNADGSTATFEALAAVPQELCSVIADPKKKEFCASLGAKQTGVIGGLMLADDEFTLQNFQNNLGKTPVVHIASHFALNAGDETDSYLLLGGGAERRFSLLSLKKTRLDKVELLTLSACNTAMTSGSNSSGVEIEGFGALAQNQGARTVLATLWSVADDSTRDLMTRFYGELETDAKTGKAEALRRAQTALLNGKYKSEDGVKSRGVKIVNLNGKQSQPTFARDADAPFAHPFFWSPFVLFGNWR